MEKPSVCIVLATMNGAKWLPGQLKSLQQQSADNWCLLLSDDGSTDQTLDIALQFAAQDHRIVVLPARDGPAGHVANFEYLLNQALRAQIAAIFLCDQDDLWEQKKLEKLSAVLARAGSEPAAVFSDMELIDDVGRPLGSFMGKQQLRGVPSLEHLLGQNVVAGCSLALNEGLLKLALPFPEGLCNHDWWLALCASALGALRYHPERLTEYRQHQANAIGGGWTVGSVRRTIPIIRRQRRVFFSKVCAVQVLLGRLQDAGITPPEVLLRFAASFERLSGWNLPLQLLNSGFAPQSLMLRLVQILAVSPLFSVEGRREG